MQSQLHGLHQLSIPLFTGVPYYGNNPLLKHCIKGFNKGDRRGRERERQLQFIGFQHGKNTILLFYK